MTKPTVKLQAWPLQNAVTIFLIHFFIFLAALPRHSRRSRIATVHRRLTVSGSRSNGSRENGRLWRRVPNKRYDLRSVGRVTVRSVDDGGNDVWLESRSKMNFSCDRVTSCVLGYVMWNKLIIFRVQFVLLVCIEWWWFSFLIKCCFE